MDSEKFVSVIKQVVEENGIRDVLENLTALTGTGKDSRMQYLVNWYKELDDQGKECVKQIIRESTSITMFGFFCVLDGVRAIENGPEKGNLELYYLRGKEKCLLNDFNEDFLHDIYKSFET